MDNDKALKWDQVGQKLYETGTKKGVLYVMGSNGAYGEGEAWNGLTGITQSPSGADENELYADDIKYLGLRGVEKFGGTITAYTYPDGFAKCNGEESLVKGVTINQQNRATFGLSYVTTIGNDVDNLDHGYKIHLVYGATVSPSSKDYKTQNESPEAIEFSWEFSTTPVDAGTGFKPTAHVEIDSTKVNATKLEAFEKILYGDGTTASRLPLPTELASLFAEQ